jgi:preprotein translocase subunit SecA
VQIVTEAPVINQNAIVTNQGQEEIGEQKKQIANTKKKIEGENGEKKKLGRNDPCWCGSGKKYKKCHYPQASA